MDSELVFWILFFVGGYSLVVGYLLRIALRQKEQTPGSPSD